MIRIQNLHKSFGDLNVLKGIDLEVKKGEVVSIIGPSGTGKSTLLRCLNYLERPEKGIITIADVTIDAEHAHEKTIHELRKHSAMIFQSYNLFNNKDALHNVMEPLITAKKKDRKEAEAGQHHRQQGDPCKEDNIRQTLRTKQKAETRLYLPRRIRSESLQRSFQHHPLLTRQEVEAGDQKYRRDRFLQEAIQAQRHNVQTAESALADRSGQRGLACVRPPCAGRR